MANRLLAYMDHLPWCASFFDLEEDACNCGFRETLEEHGFTEKDVEEGYYEVEKGQEGGE